MWRYSCRSMRKQAGWVMSDALTDRESQGHHEFDERGNADRRHVSDRTSSEGLRAAAEIHWIREEMTTDEHAGPGYHHRVTLRGSGRGRDILGPVGRRARPANRLSPAAIATKRARDLSVGRCSRIGARDGQKKRFGPGFSQPGQDRGRRLRRRQFIQRFDRKPPIADRTSGGYPSAGASRPHGLALRV
jgi:hypothetical protein